MAATSCAAGDECLQLAHVCRADLAPPWSSPSRCRHAALEGLSKFADIQAVFAQAVVHRQADVDDCDRGPSKRVTRRAPLQISRHPIC